MKNGRLWTGNRHLFGREEEATNKMPVWWHIRLPTQEMQETQVQSLGWEDPLEEGTATHSSVLS